MGERRVRVAIVGATGLVGEMMRTVLAERKFPASDVLLLASERSSGAQLEFNGGYHKVLALKPGNFEGVDIALFGTEAEISREYVKVAAQAGAVAIDNSSAFRMEEGVPLVVPEVNPESLRNHNGIIANPNCSTIQMVVVLWPIHKHYGLKRVVVSTYQSVSGHGRRALEELADQMSEYKSVQSGSPYSLQAEARTDVFPYPIICNLIPHIDSFLENGYTREEMKMIEETRKIMGLPDLKITATCVRVPVLFSHSESVNVETEREIDPDEARSLLAESPSIKVMDEPRHEYYPLPTTASNTDMVYVGRIRCDWSVPSGINMWIVADNLRKGAATNAVQIAEKLLDLSLL
jgi:aspartate-semialdehyde dehydrogenase